MVTMPWKIFSNPPSQYSRTSWCAVKPVSMNARRFSRIASRPCQSATPRFPIASLVKQSNPLPKVLSSISFQKANSHSGGSFFVNVMVMVMVVSFEGSVWVSGSEAAVQLPLEDGAGQDQSTQAGFGGNAKKPSVRAKC